MATLSLCHKCVTMLRMKKLIRLTHFIINNYKELAHKTTEKKTFSRSLLIVETFPIANK